MVHYRRMVKPTAWLLSALLAIPALAGAQAAEAGDWRRASPGDGGLSAEKLSTLAPDIRAGKFVDVRTWK